MVSLEEVVPKEDGKTGVMNFKDCNIPSNDINVNDCLPKRYAPRSLSTERILKKKKSCQPFSILESMLRQAGLDGRSLADVSAGTTRR